MRIFNRLLALAVACAIAAAGIITIVEVIGERGFSSGPVIVDWRSMLRWGQHQTWQALSVEIACGAAALIGLVLVLAQLKRGRPSKVSLRAADNTAIALTRYGVATAVRSAVLDVEGISRAKVRVKRRRIAVKARSAAVTSTQARTYCGPVRDAVSDRLDPLQLQQRQRIKVRVHSRGKEEEH